MLISRNHPRQAAKAAVRLRTLPQEEVMHQGPAPESGPDPASGYKTRLGVVMFFIYCVVYVGFILTNVMTDGEAMQIILFMGLNLAVVYGVGLIVLALVMALIYNHKCTRKETEMAQGSVSGEETA